jgi:transposase
VRLAGTGVGCRAHASRYRGRASHRTPRTAEGRHGIPILGDRVPSISPAQALVPECSAGGRCTGIRSCGKRDLERGPSRQGARRAPCTGCSAAWAT